MAQILCFPTKSGNHRETAIHLGATVTAMWQDRHLPVIAAAVDLLDLDDRAFASRLAGMRDREGSALVLELVDAITETSGEIDLIFRSLFLVRSRLRVGISSLTEDHNHG